MTYVRLLAIAVLLFCPPADACFQDCKTDDTGLAAIRSFEGYFPFVYSDAAGVPTIGFGHALKRGERISEPLLTPDAETLLQADLRAKERAINRVVKVPLGPHQFDALADFTYNLGEGNLARSTLLKRVNARRHTDVQLQFMAWTKAGGIELRGLRLRRQAEAALYAVDLQ